MAGLTLATRPEEKMEWIRSRPTVSAADDSAFLITLWHTSVCIAYSLLPTSAGTVQSGFRNWKGVRIMPRVAPITGKADVAAEYHGVVDGVLKVFGQVRGPFSMLLHSPKLAEQMLNLGNFYRDQSIVASKDRSLAILIAVR